MSGGGVLQGTSAPHTPTPLSRAFVKDLKAHGADPAMVQHVCQDISAAYTKGVGLALPDAAISYDRFHVIKLVIDAMDDVRRTEWREQPRAVPSALGSQDKKARRCARA
jgi:transposase